MRGTVSLLASALLVNAFAAEDLAGMFQEGKASGQIRAFYIDRSVDYTNGSSVDFSRDALSVGGYLKYETGTFNGLNFGTAFYTTNKLDSASGVARENDTTLMGAGGKNDAYLGEAYLQYKTGNTAFKMGRQKLDTPLAGSDDARMSPNLFEAYVLSNSDLAGTTLIAAHVTKFAAGTFANSYSGGEMALTYGYSFLPNASTSVGHFQNMGTYAIGQHNDGVSVLAAIYSGIPGLKVQVWDYYAHDILNALYAEANYNVKISDGIETYLGAQYIQEGDIGDKLAGVVNSTYMGGKIGVKVANFDLSGALSHTDSDDTATINGGIITPWGGMPAYTQGMVTRHQFMAGTDAWKVAGTYNFKDMGANLTTSLYYASFDVPGYTGSYTSGTSTETGFDVIWNPEAVKNLQLRLRGNFTDKFKNASEDTSWDEYRLIANYNF